MSHSPAPAPTPQSPQTSLLLSLPVELLARIVDYVQLQDCQAEEHRQRVMDLQANGQLVKALQGLWIEEGRGTSLHSVFRTCVQLSELAAPLIFETLRSDQCRQETFHSLVASRRRLCFKTLHFEGSTHSATLDILRYAPFFSRVSTLLYPPPFTLSSPSQIVQVAYRDLARRISHLRIRASTSQEVITQLELFNTLASLDIEGSVFSEDDNVALVDVVAALGSLRTLSLSPVHGLMPAWKRTTLQSSLRTLTLTASVAGPTDWAFIGAASPLLELLSFVVHGHIHLDEHILLSFNFPRLRRLDIQGTLDTVSLSLGAFTAPSLVHLSVALKARPGLTDLYKEDSIIRTFCGRHPLRTFEFDNLLRFDEAERIGRHLAFCASQDLQCPETYARARLFPFLLHPRLQFVPSTGADGGDGRRAALATGVVAVRSALSFATAQLELAQEEGDLDAILHLVAHLRAVGLARGAFVR